MRENKRDFLTNVENACHRIKGVGDALDCIASSDYLSKEFGDMFDMFAKECFLISEMIDETKFDRQKRSRVLGIIPGHGLYSRLPNERILKNNYSSITASSAVNSSREFSLT